MAPSNTTSQSYTLHYWPSIPGRGEFIRLAFESVGHGYKESNNVGKLTMTTANGIGHPSHFAVPMLEVTDGPAMDDERSDADGTSAKTQKTEEGQDVKSGRAVGSTFISQTPAILNYLAPILGLDGTGSLKDQSAEAAALRRAQVLQLTLTALDVNNEAHDTHHPVASAAYFEEQKDEAKRRSDDFRTNRLPKYLEHFTMALTSNPSNSGWLVGSELTVADLTLFQIIDGLKFAFPKRMATLEKDGSYGAVFALHKKVAELPKIAKYLKSDKRKSYGHGIFRHYPELDGKD